MRKLAEGYVTASAQVTGDPKFKPGNTVSCSKFGEQIDGVYRIESARHLFSRHGYLVDFKAVRIAKKTAQQKAQARSAQSLTGHARTEADNAAVEREQARKPRQKNPAAAQQAKVMKEAAKKGSPLIEECPSSKGTLAQVA